MSWEEKNKIHLFIFLASFPEEWQKGMEGSNGGTSCFQLMEWYVEIY